MRKLVITQITLSKWMKRISTTPQENEPPCAPFKSIHKKSYSLPHQQPIRALITPPSKKFFWLLKKVNRLAPLFWLLRKVNRLAPPLNPFIKSPTPHTPTTCQPIKPASKTFFWLLKTMNRLAPLFWLLRKVNRLAPPLNPFIKSPTPSPHQQPIPWMCGSDNE